MAKYCGNIIFSTSVETKPGVWTKQITKKKYIGELTRASRNVNGSDKLNDDISISNQISIIADPYINENLFAIKAVEFMGTAWKVNNIDVQYPRLILSIGGVWNGSKSSSISSTSV